MMKLTCICVFIGLTMMNCGNACNHVNSVIGSLLVQVSKGPIGMWGVDRVQNIYCVENNIWKEVPGILKQVSVGGYVWGTQDNALIFFREGVTDTNQCGTIWTKIPGKATQISVSPSGKLWVHYKEKIFYRKDTPKVPIGTGWVEATGIRTRHISAGLAGLWAIDTTYKVHYRIGTHGDKDTGGTGWIPVSGPEMIYLDSSNGTVYAIDRLENQYYRTGINIGRETGFTWQMMNTKRYELDDRSSPVLGIII